MTNTICNKCKHLLPPKPSVSARCLVSESPDSNKVFCEFFTCHNKQCTKCSFRVEDMSVGYIACVNEV